MGKLSEYARKRIISLRSSGTTQTKIKELLEQEGIKTSRSAISLFLSRYSKTGDIGDAPRSGRTAVNWHQKRSHISTGKCTKTTN